MAGVVRIEPLNADNYDTWKLHMRAVLIKNDLWAYVNGNNECPADRAAAALWKTHDEKACADIMLAIGSTELNLISECTSSQKMWQKLQSTFESKGPARKATLLKRVALSRMKEGELVRNHLNDFFDAVAKLKEIGVEIGDELLAILLLYSLPDSYETFRCALETRDDLPKPEVLRVKILEEWESRKAKNERSESDALYVKNKQRTNVYDKNRNNDYRCTGGKRAETKRNFCCYKCGKSGHYAKECRSKNQNNQRANKIEETNSSLRATETVLSCANGNDSWCLDSGCTSHMSAHKNNFVEMVELNQVLNLANKNYTNITGAGDVQVKVNEKGRERNITLKDVLYVSDLRTNLLSVSKMTNKGYEVHFRKNNAIVIDENENVLFTAERSGNLYFMNNIKNSAFISQTKSEINLWHCRMGHLNERDLKEMAKNGDVHGLKINTKDMLSACEVCASEKQTRTTFPKSTGNRTEELLEIVHSDVCGPMRCTSNGGKNYFVTFIDDKSRWCEIYFIKQKSDVLEAFKNFKNAAETFTGKKVKALQSDNGREYCNREFDIYLQKHGIKRRLTTPHTPQQNGVAERKNRTLVEMARCLMKQAGVPSSFWAEAINTSCYIRNRCITKSTGEVPHKTWTGKTPTVTHFKVFGSKAYVLNKQKSKGKFESRSEPCVFVGYSDESKAYRLYSKTKKRIIISRDVKFIDKLGFNGTFEDFEQESEKDNENENKIDVIFENNNTDSVVSDEESISVPQSVAGEYNARRGRGRPTCVRTGQRGRPKKVYRQTVNGINSEEDAANSDEFYECNEDISARLITEDPQTLAEALKSEDASMWLKALEDEFLAHMRNKTWQIVERPSNRKVIGNKFVFRTKDENLKKVRLVAKGYAQRPGEDFHEISSPVVRSTSVRFFTALAAELDLQIHQMDVVTAYLNGDLDENVYMDVPDLLMSVLKKIQQGQPVGLKGMTKHSNEIQKTAEEWRASLQRSNTACLVKKALYGLRQSGLMWYHKLSLILNEIGLKPTKFDPCFYVRREGSDTMFVIIYVDDLLLASNNGNWIKTTKEKLSQNFDMKDIGNVNRCLGINFHQNLEKGEIFLSQRSYAESVLNRFGMSECNPSKTPIETNCNLTLPARKDEAEMAKFPFQSLIGALMYLAVSTRPDIAYAVNFMSQFNNNYTEQHWKAAKRILRYIKGTLQQGLLYKKTGADLYGVVDADWGANSADRRSYSGFAFIFAGSSISWEARKQRTVSLSSTEAEYIAITEATKEALYLKAALHEVGINCASVKLFNDNQSAQKLAVSSNFHPRTKHIDIRHHFIRDCVQTKMIILEYMSTQQMPADILTKGLTHMKHSMCSSHLGLVEFSSEE